MNMTSKKWIIINNVVTIIGVLLCILSLLFPFFIINVEGSIIFYYGYQNESILLLFIGAFIVSISIILKKFGTLIKVIGNIIIIIPIIIILYLYLRLLSEARVLFTTADLFYGIYFYLIGIILLWLSIVIKKILK